MIQYRGNAMRTSNHGFTLLELMTAIAVLGLLIAMGIPSFNAIINNNRVINSSNDLVVALNFARSEAIKRGDPVSVCAGNTAGTGCLTSGTSWAGGWIAFTDATGTNGVIDAGDAILQAWPQVDGPLAVTAGSRRFIQYTPNGMINPSTQETFNVRKNGCVGNNARLVTVTPTGRVSSGATACP